MPSQSSSIVYLSHGGGPLPLLGDKAHHALIEALKKITRAIDKPEAIVVFSAHWETDDIEITGGTQPSLIYDYFGFPEESYSITYPAKGIPELACDIASKLNELDIPVSVNPRRGFDHGMFVPLKLMYPHADIPCIQISLSRKLDPSFHIELGEALRAFREKNILFIGSGSSFHNLRHFFNPSEEDIQKNNAFHQWLNHTMCDATVSEASRKNSLINWKQAPYSLFCHPREEHLIPLHICYGLAGKGAEQVYSSALFGMQLSCFRWN